VSVADRERALETVRMRFLLNRRIVPFLVHQEHERGSRPAEIAGRLGLREEDVRAYVDEVEREVRTELERRYTPEETPTRHG
jgi:hypothetical protein